ncbi:neutral/alkaline non-lysosomal ceramidase N-terminal domain-containing protein [Singulisphaera sp. GP187]|uniref:neutral/alkaline non-lysosomal ceramidase N-terminal domain-containing protein n=1 Tax=Singulisphaera sp. GP187 TaxID=1882752 RepID=UPI001C1FE904|nr:neutral/alkaline non-lysosomal ceramidase N-terminal domain-containing protein [Singulisphaera sp. GP187]
MSHPRLWLPLLAATLAAMPVGSSVQAQGAAPPSWKAGAASAKITPDTEMWMAGYAARTKPAEGVELDLYAKALVIEDQAGTPWALVTLDLIGIPRNVRLFVAEQVEKQHGIAPERLVLNASHTHSGPELRTERSFATADPAKYYDAAAAYTNKLQSTLVRLIGEAKAKLEPAKLDYCHARCGFAMNRRRPNGKGGYNNAPNPEGPVDLSVPVLRVATANNAGGKELAFIFGYSCHCTTLGHQRFSGDYAGYAQQYLQEAHPGVISMFMNGCGGDQNPYPRNTMELAQAHGRSLATAVEAALTTSFKPLSGKIRAAYREIPLAYDTLPTREQLEAQTKSGTKLDADHATRVLSRLNETGSLPTDYPYPVQVTRLGDQLTWVTLGGEVVVDYALRLKQEIKDPIVWVSGYSNDVMTYIPSLRVWKEGGYEAGEAMKWGTHPTRWSERIEEQIIATVHELRRSLNP